MNRGRQSIRRPASWPLPLRKAIQEVIHPPARARRWASVSFAAGLIGVAPVAPAQVLDLSGLDGANGFKVNGEARFDGSGRSVSEAGDINGDNIDDFIIGAAYSTPRNGEQFSGASYVIFGREQSFNTPLELSALNGSNGFRLDGERSSDLSGRTVSKAGDVNGDGIDDVIIGAYRADFGGPESGSSYVVFGREQGFDTPLKLSTLNGENGFRIDGETANGFASSVSGAGDVNGDGFADVIIGELYDANDYGASYVVFGSDQGFITPLSLTTLDGSNGFKINGEAYGDESGGSVSAAGDINGDGIGDVIIGAKLADSYSGSSYVVFGTDQGFSTPLDLATLDGTNGFKIRGEAENHLFGVSVSAAGDVNGDGIDDVIIGAKWAGPNRHGASYVLFGSDQGFSTPLEISTLDGSNGFKMSGSARLDSAGESVSGGGDVNGDGFDDVIIGASEADPNGERSGASYVVFGTNQSFSTPLELSGLDGTNGFKINGETEGDQSGFSVSTAGDINRDGIDDLIIGAFAADPNGSRSGASYVVFGSPTIGQTQTGIEIAKQIDGIDADLPGGPRLVAGSSYRATYRVTNTGNVVLRKVKVFDRQIEPATLPWQKICALGTVNPGVTKSCSQPLVPVLDGQRNILGIAQGTAADGTWIKAKDPAYYFGEVNPVREIEMDKRINDEPADNAPGVSVDIGADLSFSYQATNTGNVDLFRVKIYDREVVPDQTPWDLVCTLGRLVPGQSSSCDPVVRPAQAGQHNILGIARGKDSQDRFTKDNDNAFYFGQADN